MQKKQKEGEKQKKHTKKSVRVRVSKYFYVFSGGSKGICPGGISYTPALVPPARRLPGYTVHYDGVPSPI